MFPGIITSVLLVLFLIGSAWVWSPRRKHEFDAAARLAIEESADSEGSAQP